MAEIDDLRAAVARLDQEIAYMRSQLSYISGRLAPQAWLPNAAAACTCNMTAVGCRAHPRTWPSTVYSMTGGT